MIRSMTAFSRQDQSTAEVMLSWEIRTVNHRYLDISLHLPTALSSLENELKELVRAKLGRGKLDGKLTLEISSQESDNKITINEAKVKALLSARKKIEGISKIPLNLSAMEILNWSGVIEKQQSNTLDENQGEEVKALLEAALDDLIEMRALEGSRLAEMIKTRCKTITKIIASVRVRRVEVQAVLREKVLKKLLELDVTADNNRLEQELVYQAQRLDVDEELDRLNAHIEEIQEILKRDEPVGRRLDFLMQELNREANTLASKSNDVVTTKAAVDLKVLIEQIREQCLNIE